MTSLGLRTAPSRPPSALSLSDNLSPAFIGFHFFWAYCVLAPRHLKQWHGIDHNVSPRYDLSKYGDEAVRKGKVTQQMLEMMQRNESAQANSIENYPLFIGALGFASLAGVDTRVINRVGVVYTLARVAYSGIYVFVDQPMWSLFRSLAWWVGNSSCLYLLWKASASSSTNIM